MYFEHISNLDYSLEIVSSFFDQATALAVEIQQLTDELDILNLTVEQTRKIIECDRVLIYQLIPKGDGVILAESVGKQWTPIHGQLVDDPCFREKWIESYGLGRISTIEDIYTKPTESCYLELLQRFQVRANLVVPIIIRNSHPSRLWGLLIVHQCDAPRSWHSLEIKLLQNISAQVGIALGKIIAQEESKVRVQQELNWKEMLLRWKETLLRSMTDSSPLGFYVVDNRTDKILYFNHRFCEIWGLENLEAKMQLGVLKNNDIIPKCSSLIADLPAFIDSCKPLQNEENRVTLEDEIIFSDRRTIRRFSSQIRDDQDRYFGRMYLFEDITQRKQLDAELKDSERRWQYALEGNGDGVWDWNIPMKFIFLIGGKKY
jgi:PAS domain-containing protein